MFRINYQNKQFVLKYKENILSLIILYFAQNYKLT